LLVGAVVLPSKKNPYSSADQSRGFQPAPRLYGLYGDDLGEEAYGSLGGAPSNIFSSGVQIAPVGPGTYEITLDQTGTDWQETFVLGVPPGPLKMAPLLVLFHGYGEQPRDLLTKTTYFELARARGWYVVAPLGAHQYNFGIEYSQRNVEQALNWVARAVPVDVTRLYAVGFSMGGGMAASYAARHQDIYSGRFAAVVNHTGVTSLSHSFRMAADDRLFLSPLMFGASPDQDPFAYSRCSSFDLDPIYGTIDPNTDMLRNLASTPVRIYAALQDPISILLTQTEHFETQLALRGGSGDSLRGPYAVHDWYTMNEASTLDWLSTKQLGAPNPYTTYNLLADRSARWHGFWMGQREPNRLMPLTYQVQPNRNRLYTIGTENLARIDVFPQSLGLRTSDVFEWVFGNQDAAQVQLVIRGVTHYPFDVTRNGVSTIAWSYDPILRQMVLLEDDAASVPRWSVHF